MAMDVGEGERMSGRIAEVRSPCQACGACCATSADWPRFSLESEEDLARIPAALVAAGGGGMRAVGDRCAALQGEVGTWTACAVYAVRPLVCRDCVPGDDACSMARERHAMAAVAVPADPDPWPPV